ncbi:MAG: hypothetical protein AB8E15_11000 [Bdellovibrionales bacterium]
MTSTAIADSEGSLLTEASFSFKKGHLYRSLKIFEGELSKQASDFIGKFANEYLDTYHTLSTDKKLKKICNEIKSKLNKTSKPVFLRSCIQKALINSDLKWSRELVRELSKIDSSLETNLVIASHYLIDGNPELCIEHLNKKKTIEYEKSNLGDLRHLTSARCESTRKNYELASLDLLKVAGSSKKYFDALFELAWLSYKQGDNGNAKQNLYSIISSFQGFDAQIQTVNSKNYFDARLLRAYIYLAQNNMGKVSFETESLVSDLKSYRDAHLVTQNQLNTFFKNIEKIPSNWIKVQENSKIVLNIISGARDWLGHKKASFLERELIHFIALKAEKRDIESSSNAQYKRQISDLYDAKKKSILILMKVANNQIESKVKGFELKTLLLGNESRVLADTQGIKGKEDLQRKFRERGEYLDRYFGGSSL